MDSHPLLPPSLICSQCQATGFSGWRRCSKCFGFSVGQAPRKVFLYWQYPLTRYHLKYARARIVFNKIRLLLTAVVALNFWVWAGFYAFRFATLRQLFDFPAGTLTFWRAVPANAGLLFWLGALFLTYAWYRHQSERPEVSRTEKISYEREPIRAEPVVDFAAARRFSRRQRLNIATVFTPEALAAVARGYQLADRGGQGFTPRALFIALLSFNRIGNIFIRLGIPAKSLLEHFNKSAPATASRPAASSVAPELWSALFVAYEDAAKRHQPYVSVTELLAASLAIDQSLSETLFNLGVETPKLLNVIAWARIREQLQRQYEVYRHAARHRSKYGLDRAMTAVATPYLNKFSEDITALAQFGYLPPCVARDQEIEEIFRVVEGGQSSVLLAGDFGVGKKSIIEGIAARMAGEDVPAQLSDKRLVRLSIPTLLSGATPTGAVERLIRIMNEIGRAGNIILFIHNIQELVGVSAGGAESLDVAGTLAEYIGGGHFFTFATTTTRDFAEHIANTKLATVFAKVDIAEMDQNQAVQALESKVGGIEYKQKVFFAYDAIAKAVELAKRFLRDTSLPGSALELITEAASVAHSVRGLNTLVTAEDVATVVAQKTKIPVTAITADETTKLMQLEETMRRRVIGQDEAVALVANALRRARVELRSQNRPIANFLFLGPTGVGKTELAKTIAAVYFGGSERMIRLDMSEYQDKSSINRLIGAPGASGTGVLTAAIRQHPFSLLLLDEIEKADKDVLNLFLQVMDDGRLTDSTGRVADFTNVILIATSNAGTSYVGEQFKLGLAAEAVKSRLLHGELNQYFRPEFLNRFDGVVLFKPLSRDDITRIARLLLEQVGEDLAVKGITLEIQPAALNFLAEVGFDPDFGARPLRRAIQERIENQLAELLLSGAIKRHDTITVGAGGAVTVRRPA